MKKLIIAVIFLIAGCSTPLDTLTSALKPDTGITAQVGAANTKQGLGVNSSVDTSTEQETKIEGNANQVDNSTTKGITLKDTQKAKVTTQTGSSSTGAITAEKVNVVNGSVWPVVAVGLGSLTLVLLFVITLLWLSFRRLKSISDKEITS